MSDTNDVVPCSDLRCVVCGIPLDEMYETEFCEGCEDD